MSLDQLIATMEARGAAEVGEILHSARSQAVAAARDALERMRRRRDDVVHEHERAWERDANAAVAEVRRGAAAQVLEARAAAMERVWRRALDKLSQDEIAQRLRRVAGNHVTEALPYLEGKDVVVRCDADVAAAVQTALEREGRSVAIEIDVDAELGVTVTAADGSVSIDNTLQARLARLRPKLATEITSRLTALASSTREETDDARLE